MNNSQRLSEKPLTAWVIAEKDGRIIAGHCDCMAGLGDTCSHVASMLWAIESGVCLRESMTVTQKKAYWVIPNNIEDVPRRSISLAKKESDYDVNLVFSFTLCSDNSFSFPSSSSDTDAHFCLGMFL